MGQFYYYVFRTNGNEDQSFRVTEWPDTDANVLDDSGNWHWECRNSNGDVVSAYSGKLNDLPRCNNGRHLHYVPAGALVGVFQNNAAGIQALVDAIMELKREDDWQDSAAADE